MGRHTDFDDVTAVLAPNLQLLPTDLLITDGVLGVALWTNEFHQVVIRDSLNGF